MILQEIEKVTQDEDQDFYALSQDSHWQLTNSGEFCLHVVADYLKLTCQRMILEIYSTVSQLISHNAYTAKSACRKPETLLTGL